MQWLVWSDFIGICTLSSTLHELFSNILFNIIPRSSGWTPRSNNGKALQVEKNIPGLQAAVSLMLLSKNLLFSTLSSQITNDFVWKSHARYHSLIHFKFCQPTLSHNLSCNDEFGQILLEYAPSLPPYMNYLAIFCPP